MKIGVRSLSTYSVGADGDTIALDLLDSNENTVTLDMSVDQVGMLAMTLPKLIETALKRRFHDASLRYSYAAGSYFVEQASDPNSLIVTFQTNDGFGASFTLSRDNAKELSEALSLGASSAVTIAAH